MNTTQRAELSSPAQRVAQGYALLQSERWAEALAYARDLARVLPTDPNVLMFAAEASLAGGDMQEALTWTDRTIVATGGDWTVKLKKARLLAKMRRRDEEARLLNEVAAQAGGGDGKLHWELGRIYYTANLQAQAIEQFQIAQRLLGDQPGLLYDIAVSRFFAGDLVQAEVDLDRTLSLAPQSGHALYLRATLRRQTVEQNHIDFIEQQLAAGFKDVAHEASAWFALAKELEDVGDYERSFNALLKATAKKRSTYSYDLAAECEAFQSISAAYSAEVIERTGAGFEDSGAIFVVGMPRTGTTLLERMLVQSGKVKAAGELLDFGTLLGTAAQLRVVADPSLTLAQASTEVDFRRIGEEYMRGAREAASGSPRFIDKMPVNFMYCGIIQKALPNAKIIHLVRDPLDCCYAVLKTQFFSAYSFSYNLEELADYYIAYRKLMDHWHQVMPGKILDVRYEDLVNDTETQVQRVYEWCGLPWDPSVIEQPGEGAVFATASAAQVRQPVHTRSVHSSRRHLQGLAPLVSKLEAAGIEIT